MAETTLRDVVERLRESTDKQNEAIDAQLDIVEMDKKIAALQGGLLGESSENANLLREQFAILSDRIENSSGAVRERAIEDLQILGGAVESEEEKREKKKQLEMQTSALGKLATGLEGFDKTLNGMLDGAGKAAFGFGALALLFNPQLFLDGVFYVVELLSDAFNALGALISGDVLGFLGLFAENFVGFSVILGILAVKFGVISKVAAGIRKAQDLYAAALAFTQSQMFLNARSLLATASAGGIRGVIALLGTGLTALGATILTTATAIGTAVTGFAAAALPAIGAFLVAAAPFVAVAAGIALLVGGIVTAFKNIKERFTSTGSLLETIGGFILDIVTFPITFLKNVIAKIAGFFGFDKVAEGLKEFSITDAILGGIKMVVGFIKNIFMAPFKLIGGLFDNLFSGFGSLMGLLFAPVTMFIDFVKSIFSFDLSMFEGFSITDMLAEVWNNITGFISDLLPSFEDIKNALNPFSWFGGDDDKEEEKEVKQAKTRAEKRTDDAVDTTVQKIETVSIEQQKVTEEDTMNKLADAVNKEQTAKVTEKEKRRRGGPTKERKQAVGAPAPIIEFNPEQVMTAPEPMPEREPVVINETDSPELKEAKSILVHSQLDLEDYKDRQSWTAFPDSPELQASETKYYESIIKENTERVQQLEKAQEEATKQTAERKTTNETPMQSPEVSVETPFIPSQPEINVPATEMPEKIAQPPQMLESVSFESITDKIKRLFTGDTDRRVVPRIPKTSAMVAKIPEIESSTPDLPATGITPESIVNNTVSEVQNVSESNEAPNSLTQFISEKYGISPEKVQAMMSAMQKSNPLVSMGKSLFDKASGFIGKLFGGDEETPEVAQQAVVASATQSTEALLPNSPVNQLRDTQVEANGLVAQEKQEAATNNNAVMVAATGGKRVQSTNNVSSKTVNITNDVSMDSLLREFSYNPVG